MNDIISLIGTIASIGSIPLGIYFFIKGKEEKQDKVKRDIVKILLYQLNDSSLVSIFEIQSVLNSKCRENKVNVDSISITEIIDDLLSEIISNPLLQKENKRTFITNLKFLSHRILTTSDIDVTAETITLEKLKEVDEDKIELELQREQEKLQHVNKSENLSQIFSKITTSIGLLAALAAVSSEFFFNSDVIKKFFEKSGFLWAIIIGIVVSTLGAVISYFIKKSVDNKN